MKENGMQVRLVVYSDLGHAFPPNSSREIEKALEWIEQGE
jgi:dipeptidyl aminopeptidase/acylaminoacyl peptidase